MLTIEKIASERGLKQALKGMRASSLAGIDGIRLKPFRDGLKDTDKAEMIVESLVEGNYRPEPLIRILIPKLNGTWREIFIPTIQDRAVQRMLVRSLQPMTEARFHERSYGFRPGRNTRQALLEARRLTMDGYGVSLLIDLSNFFGNIDRERLRKLLRDYDLDEGIRRLINAFITVPVLGNRGRLEKMTGIPAGIPIAPPLANLYLHPLDKMLDRMGIPFVRYADDITLFFKSRQACKLFENEYRSIEQRYGIIVNPQKTKCYEEEPRPLLGYVLDRYGGVTCSPKVLDGMTKSLGLLDRSDKSLRENALALISTAKSISHYYEGVIDNFEHLQSVCNSVIEAARNHVEAQHTPLEIATSAGMELERIEDLFFHPDIARTLLPDICILNRSNRAA